MSKPPRDEVEKPRIVAVFDVRVPKRFITRTLQPIFFARGKPIVIFHFLGNRFSYLKSDPQTRCDHLSDEDLVREIELRYERFWQKKLCFLFTTDRGFYKMARRAIRKSNILLVRVPLWGKEHFTRREAQKQFSVCIIKMLREALSQYKRKGSRAYDYFQRRLQKPGDVL